MQAAHKQGRACRCVLTSGPRGWRRAAAQVLVGAVLGSVLGVLCLLLAGGAALAEAQRRRRAVRRAARAAARKAAKQQQQQHGGGDNDDGASTLERGRGEARHHNAASTGATTSLQLLV